MLQSINDPVFVCIHGNDLEWICDDCDALVEQYIQDEEDIANE